MTLAFIIAFIVAVLFIILWSEEREKRVQAEQKNKQLTKEIKKFKSKSKSGFAAVEISRKTREYVIPQPPQKKDKTLLDQSKLAELKEQTKAAQEMLAEIFVQEEEHEKVVVMQPDMNPLIKTLGKLLTKEQWKRTEVAELVGPDVMIGNLLEQINDYAYPIVNDIVVEEDGDIIYVTTEYKEQLV